MGVHGPAHTQPTMGVNIKGFIAIGILMFASVCSAEDGSPMILENPTDLLVPVKEPAILNCHATGHPTPTITWYKDGQPMGPSPTGRYLLLETGDLFFLRVFNDQGDSDAGIYWCVATNHKGNATSTNATLEVAVLEDEFYTMPDDTQVAEGEPALLSCVPPHGNPQPVVTWQRDGETVDPASDHRYRIVDGANLVITGVRRSDAGTYKCMARNIYGERLSEPATLTVLVSPNFVEAPSSVLGEVGDTVDLLCSVEGDPQPEVFWRRVTPHDQLPVGRMSLEERSQVLRIHHVVSADSGIYSCHAENPVGAAVANITLEVIAAPSIDTTPKEGRVDISGTASYECYVSGSPMPSVYWTKEGSGVLITTGQSTSDGRLSVDAHNTLAITNVQHQDQGYYVCSSVGVAGSALSRVHLEVLNDINLPPPIISLAAPNQTLPLGTEAEMPCEVRGVPEPHVYWMRSGKVIKSDDRTSISSGNTLKITGLKVSDTDVYTCVASSEAGETIWTTALVVAKPTNPNIAFYKMPDIGLLPDPPEHVEVVNVNTTVVMLGWKHSQSGMSFLLGYTVQYWSPDLRGPWRVAQTEQTPTSAYSSVPVAIAVTGLQPSTEYIFAVRARNSYGVSPPSQFTHLVKTPSKSNGILLPLYDVQSQLSKESVRILNVEPMSKVLKIKWTFLVDAALLEGIFVYYRPIKDNNGKKPGALQVEKVSLYTNIGPPPTSHLLYGLHPTCWYEIFLVPYYNKVEGLASSVVRSKTLGRSALDPQITLQYTQENSTTVKVSWDPISENILSYSLMVTETGLMKNNIQNITSKTNWAYVSHLNPGATYIIQLHGNLPSGVKQLSTPLLVTTSYRDTHAFDPMYPSVTENTTTMNSYLIICILVAAVCIFLLVGITIFCIYRKHMKTKCQHYHTQDGTKDLYSEYAECWESSSRNGGLTSTMYTDIGDHGAPVSKMTQQQQRLHRPPTMIPGNVDCQKKMPEEVYEDLDTSFYKSGLITGPYATTPLLKEKYYSPEYKYVGVNIPESKYNLLHHNTNYEDSNKFIRHPTNNSLKTSHFQTENGSPILKFPPPPHPDGDFSSYNSLTSNYSLHQGNVTYSTNGVPKGLSSFATCHSQGSPVAQRNYTREGGRSSLRNQMHYQ
ncbi:unnamed protein product, partial [Meganyctiphanes norvegica]